MNNVTTSYDDVFRTLTNDCRQLVVPLINEIFGTAYELCVPVTLLQNEHFLRKQDGKEDERITDSCFQILDRLYHIECQSTPDGSMIVRMFEYDFQIARDHGIIKDHILEVNLPESAVLYLRSTKNTPDQMLININTPGGKLSYPVPIVKMKNYSLDIIFQKKLYFLIPFYLFTFECKFAKMESDQKELNMLKSEYTYISKKLEELAKAGCITEYVRLTIIEMTKKVLEQLAAKYDRVRKGVDEAMGGKILDYEAKDILNEGIRMGRLEGMQAGIREGKREGMQQQSMICYLNAISRGMRHEDAMAIAEISEQAAAQALTLRKEGKL